SPDTSMAVVDVKASELAADGKVQVRIQELRQPLADLNIASQQRLIEEYNRLAFQDPRSVMSWGPDGVRLKESSELTEAEAAMVAEVSETTTKDGGTMRIKLQSKTEALKQLGERLWPVVTHIESTSRNLNINASLEALTDDQVERLIAMLEGDEQNQA
ncbi:MAG: terminase small subunit, partial [Candidatus Binatia bacterium]